MLTLQADSLPYVMFETGCCCENYSSSTFSFRRTFGLSSSPILDEFRKVAHCRESSFFRLRVLQDGHDEKYFWIYCFDVLCARIRSFSLIFESDWNFSLKPQNYIYFQWIKSTLSRWNKWWFVVCIPADLNTSERIARTIDSCYF